MNSVDAQGNPIPTIPTITINGVKLSQWQIHHVKKLIKAHHTLQNLGSAANDVTNVFYPRIAAIKYIREQINLYSGTTIGLLEAKQIFEVIEFIASN